MKVSLVLFFVYGMMGSANAQYAVSGDIQGGTPMKVVSNATIKGSPYLLVDWVPGSVVMANGHQLQGVQVMYNMIEDKLLIEDRYGKTLQLNEPAQSFEVIENEKVRKFVRASPSGYYEILVLGKFPLYRKSMKSLVDENNLGTASNIKTVLESATYHTFSDDQFQKIKLTKKAISEIINHTGYHKFVDTEQINPKKEEDLIRIFKYFGEQ